MHGATHIKVKYELFLMEMKIRTQNICIVNLFYDRISST
jgi:hypothetical protein